MAIKIRKGDTVQVIAGDDKGKTGPRALGGRGASSAWSSRR